MKIIELSKVKGAEYNPRFLSEESFNKLKQSIKELGIIKPIIVRKENSIIIAGHQRTKAMSALGIKECPAYILENIGTADEIRFNQMHNACELEISTKAPKIKILCEIPQEGKFFRVKNKDIQIVDIGKFSSRCNVLSKLMIKYGEFGCPICTPDGIIHISSAYAYSAKVTGHDMDVLCLSEEKMAKALYYLSQQYGVFSYNNLERNTYHQRFAQLKRLRDGKKGKGNSSRSVLYRKYVIPFIETQPKNIRLLDFGAGQKDYVKMLLKQGWNIKAVDPYHMKSNSQDIDIRGNAKDFLDIAEDIKKNGLYDVVICDSVLNSVDSVEAEKSVLATVRALCRPQGMIFIAGRNYERAELNTGMRYRRQYDSLIHYYDENNFTAIYRNGAWVFQKFHTLQDINDIAKSFSDKAVIEFNSESFEIYSRNENIIPFEQAIEGLKFEWNLPLPNGYRYGLSKAIEDAYRECLSSNTGVQDL